MVVALGAAGGEAEPCAADGADAVAGIFRKVFLVLCAALAGHEVQAEEAGGDFLLLGRVRDEVAGELLTGEHIEALVRVEGVDHVIAEREDAGVLVAVVADGIGVADGVEPGDGHALAVAKGGEEAIHLFFVGVGGFVGKEGLKFLGGRREAGQVEGKAAKQGGLVGGWGGFQAVLGEVRADEGVDGVFRIRLRHGGFRDGGEGPVLLVFSALLDPAGDEVFFLFGKGFVEILRRHGILYVVDALPSDALRRFSGDDGVFLGITFERGVGALGGVEAEVFLAFRGVEAVAGKALVREDGADVGVEADGFGRFRGRSAGCRRSGRVGERERGGWIAKTDPDQRSDQHGEAECGENAESRWGVGHGGARQE